ncbi:MAG: hypothetical protein ACHQ8D_23610 [Candidatus Rokuibacteriota bacterium]
MRSRPLAFALLAAAAACAKPAPKPAQATRPNWLFDVPYIAQSQLLDTTGTPEAQHVVLRSPQPIDSVAAFYRTRLPHMGWRILSDLGDTIHVSLYLERGSLPMWIQIEAEGPDSRVSFTATGSGQKPPGPASH